jgi:hypothetical protein
MDTCPIIAVINHRLLGEDPWLTAARNKIRIEEVKFPSSNPDRRLFVASVGEESMSFWVSPPEVQAKPVGYDMVMAQLRRDSMVIEYYEQSQSRAQ